MIYTPREDSHLLEKHVKIHARGRFLDMGTGSGILAGAALARTDEVIAVDINPEAAKHVHSDVKYIESDLFDKVSGQFDVIAFNPPYLPDDPDVKDMALDGGKHGYELINRFLDNVEPYLKDDGSILLLFSSLSKKNKIEECIHNNCLIFKQIDELKLDFERLYVYHIEKSPLLKDLHSKGIDKVKYLARGKRGMVFTGIFKGEKVSIKTKNPDSKAYGTIENEVKFLKVLNQHNIGPKYLFSASEFFVYKFVEGDRILDFIKSAYYKQIRVVLLEIISQLKKMDDLGINKDEMHHPLKHILVGTQPVMIDFERARYSEKPQNITQFCQFLGHISKELELKGFHVTQEQMINISKDYARSGDIDKVLEAI